MKKLTEIKKMPDNISLYSRFHNFKLRVQRPVNLN